MPKIPTLKRLRQEIEVGDQFMLPNQTFCLKKKKKHLVCFEIVLFVSLKITYSSRHLVILMGPVLRPGQLERAT